MDKYAITAQVLLGLVNLPEKGSYERDYVGKSIVYLMLEDPYMSPEEFSQRLSKITEGKVLFSTSQSKEFQEQFLKIWPNFLTGYKQVQEALNLCFRLETKSTLQINKSQNKEKKPIGEEAYVRSILQKGSIQPLL